ncbi:hypothetical protein [Nocardia sp. NPDC051570]|uniref:hypothetical protein n=1 Tax=Nocardia sp. NPDC051570 TaxID=3364324 RepID=UPI0037AC0171
MDGPIQAPPGKLRIGSIEVPRDQIPDVVPDRAIEKANDWAAYGEWEIRQTATTAGVGPAEADGRAAAATAGAVIGGVGAAALAGVPAAALGCAGGAVIGAVGGGIAGEAVMPGGGGLPGAGIGAGVGCAVGAAVTGGSVAVTAGAVGAVAGGALGYALGGGDPAAPPPPLPPPLVDLPALPPPAAEVQSAIAQANQGIQDTAQRLGQAAADSGLMPPAHITVPGIPAITIGGITIGS